MHNNKQHKRLTFVKLSLLTYLPTYLLILRRNLQRKVASAP